MPFVNIKTPEAALNADQKAEIGHCVTELLVEFFSEAAPPHTMVLIEEVKDGGYYRADETFILPAAGGLPRQVACIATRSPRHLRQAVERFLSTIQVPTPRPRMTMMRAQSRTSAIKAPTKAYSGAC